MSSKKLTPKQEVFVQEYLTDLNATSAYKRAGYKAGSDAVAASSASDLLRNPKVAAAIAAAQADRARRTEITQDYVLKGLKGEAELTGEASSPSARVAALKLLGQHLGMFAQKHEHSGPDGKPFKVYVQVDIDRV